MNLHMYLASFVEDICKSFLLAMDLFMSLHIDLACFVKYICKSFLPIMDFSRIYICIWLVL